LLHVVSDWPGHFPNGPQAVAALVGAGADIAAAEYLFEHGANVNWIGYDRRTPLDVARESGAPELVRWLEGHPAPSAGTAR
jgi:hypothetical protein